MFLPVIIISIIFRRLEPAVFSSSPKKESFHYLAHGDKLHETPIVPLRLVGVFASWSFFLIRRGSWRLLSRVLFVRFVKSWSQ